MNFDPMKIFLFIIRFGVAILLIILILWMFFSFKVEVKSDEMDRLNLELSENILASDLTFDKAVFDAGKLNAFGKSINIIDNTNNVEMPFRSCSYGYSLTITGYQNKCIESNSECRNFCRDICNINPADVTDENCRCSAGLADASVIFGDRVCQCKKQGSDTWIDKYEFSFGYIPDDKNDLIKTRNSDAVKTSQRDYEVAIANVNDDKKSSFYETVYPAKMTLTIYDSFLAKASCIAEKAYTLKKPQEISVLGYGSQCTASGNVLCIPMKTSGDLYTSNDLCTYELQQKGYTNDYKLTDCRYDKIPVVTFLEQYWSQSSYAKLIAYPIKKADLAKLYTDVEKYRNGGIFYNDICSMSQANCQYIKSHMYGLNYIAGPNDEVGAVVLCLDAEKEDNLC